MKILVTGASGQVGSAVCRLARGGHHSIVACDSKMLDISNQQALEDFFAQHEDVGLVVNAAAYTAVDAAEENSEQALLVNAVGVELLGRMAKARNIPVFHLSTDYVFDGTAVEPYQECDAVNPQSAYGRTKLEGERRLAQILPRHIILRTSWVFGVEGNNFPKTMLKLALGGREELGVVADQQGCPTFADDIAALLLFLADEYEARGDLAWGLYHFCGDSSCTWHELAEVTFQVALQVGLVKKVPLINKLSSKDYPVKATRPMYSVLCCDKLRKTWPDASLSGWRSGILGVLQAVKE